MDESKTMTEFFAQMERATRLLEQRCDRLEARIAQEDAPLEMPESATDELSQKLSNSIDQMQMLAPLLQDDSVNDILINGPDAIYVERAGHLERTDIRFPKDSDVLALANQIVEQMGRRMDLRRPVVDTRLANGSRVNIIAPPLSIDGTTISIRKFSHKEITIDTMVEQNNVSSSLGEFLKICGKCRLNIVISGGTGSGKTTLLNAISKSIDPNERVVTIEDAAELRLQQPHVIRLETRSQGPGVSKREEVGMRDLVKNALRMRPDRIILGEVRGAEAFDMMQAMNTGHEGSLTTVHANHPRDALSRLENMIGMANMNIPPKSVRYQMAAALHLIVQISRMRDGIRRITHVSEIVGMEGDVITMHDLFNYVVDGEDDNGKITGKFVWQGIMPRFTRRVAYYGEQEHLQQALGVKLKK